MLADPRLEIYACGRHDIQSGQIDRRILAMLEYLAERGYRLTITSLKCGHSILHHLGQRQRSTPSAAPSTSPQINGLPILGNQGPRHRSPRRWSTDLLAAPGHDGARPDHLADGASAARRFAMADHDDHVHVGYAPLYGPGSPDSSSSSRS